MQLKAIDLFCGAGGASDGLAAIGYEVIGLEADEAAAASHHAAGHDTDCVDITRMDPLDYAGLDIDLLWASPPCTAWSQAGKKKAHSEVGLVLEMIDVAAAGGNLAPLYARLTDKSAGLVAEPLRFIRRLMPRAVAFEQVPTAKVAWEAITPHLQAMGYSVAVEVLHAEQYGVPQTRRRAILIARRDGFPAAMPEPTHSRYYPRDPKRLDDGVLPWVTMAEALGMPAGGVTLATTAHLRAYDRSVPRGLGQPAPTVAFGKDPGNWKWMLSAGFAGMGAPRPQDEPAPTMTGKGTACWTDDPETWMPAAQRREFDEGSWPTERPSTTIVGSFRPDIVAAPGYRKPGDPPRQKTPDSVRITVEEAATLQGFAPGRPFTGSTTSRFRQVGNSVPPPLAAAIAHTLLHPEYLTQTLNREASA